MQKLFLAAAFVVTLPLTTEAAPCIAGTLANYLSPVFTGCELGLATISPFATTAATPNDVTVIPDAASLAFDFGFDLGAPPLTTIAIQFTLSGVSLNQNILSLEGAAATNDGNVTAIEFLCLGGSFFDPTVPAGCGTLETTLAVAHDAFGSTSPDSRTFAPQSFFDIFVELTVDPGVAGTASLDGTVRTAFAAAAVPEPAIVLLMGSGLCAVLARRRRRQ
jgi:hypothetical protein